MAVVFLCGCLQLAEDEYNKTNGGGWHVSSVQEYTAGAAGAMSLKVVLCSGEQCQMKSVTVNTQSKTVAFVEKKKKALF